ncbi:Rha family transcriptional regulator [Pseudomonas putida]|uniref:Rha family transcriptional regulator n=1 Tax=Pseudomonas putida TaxID=303 RepID=UPI001A8C98D1|nr:Rha family transcriptional regulator [Pseudomonas putida]
MNLVTVKDGVAVTTTLAIAEGTLNDHASVIKLARTYQTDLEEFGPVGFEIHVVGRPQGGGTPGEFAILNEPQATLLLTYMRNSEIVRAFKKKLVREFWELVQERKSTSQPDVTTQEGALIALQGAVEKQLALIAENRKIAQQRDHAIATKAEIGSRREASAMAKASAAVREAAKLRDELGFSARHATILKVEAATGRSFSFVNLRRWCKANGVTPEIVQDKRYADGVKAWPAAAWADVFDIDLAELFGAVGDQA